MQANSLVEGLITNVFILFGIFLLFHVFLGCDLDQSPRLSFIENSGISWELSWLAILDGT
jgi:hypothetical protein